MAIRRIRPPQPPTPEQQRINEFIARYGVPKGNRELPPEQDEGDSMSRWDYQEEGNQ